MIGLTFALYPIIRSGRQVHRMEGSLLLIAYAVITGLAFVLNPG
jgi:Ca2+/Na+ antiporter